MSLTPNRPAPRHTSMWHSWHPARLAAGVLGATSAALPGLALAAEQQGRALEQNENFGMVAFITVATAGGILLLASLGRMYQRQRGIRWRFQDPDAPHDSGH
jgi:hypothetical protein